MSTDSSSAGRRVLVLGANGPSGRQMAGQALDRGMAVTALTRHPEAFPITPERLEVIGGDATDPATRGAAVTGCDAVISVIGTAYTRKPVEVCSATARLAATAMRHHGVRRIVVVTSMGVPKKGSDVDVDVDAVSARSRRRSTDRPPPHACHRGAPTGGGRPLPGRADRRRPAM